MFGGHDKGEEEKRILEIIVTDIMVPNSYIIGFHD